MIRGLAGLNVAAVPDNLQKPFKPARGLQPLPGMDTLHLSKQGMTLAASAPAGFTATVRPTAGVQTYQSLQPAGTSATPTAEQPSMVERMRASMFTSNGEEGFNAKLDLDGNGRINFADVRRFLDGNDAPAIRPAEPAPSQARQDRMRAAFFSAAGNDSFDASADLNGDGRVNFADAALLRSGSATQTRPAEPVAPDMASRMRDAFFAAKGDAGFDDALDMNNDGRINFADVQALREQVTGEPARPVRPAEPETGYDTDANLSSAAPLTATDQVTPADAGDALVQSVRATFFAGKGDASFEARADINGDGRVDFRDLAALRDEQ